MSDIFISYSQGDREWVRLLVDALTEEGWDVWSDMEIRSGVPFDEAIEQQLQQVQCVVAIWSTQSVRSNWVRAEAGWAADHQKLISIQIERDIQLPIKFYQIQTEDLTGWQGSRDAPEFRKIAQDIGQFVEANPDRPDPRQRASEHRSSPPPGGDQNEAFRSSMRQQIDDRNSRVKRAERLGLIALVLSGIGLGVGPFTFFVPCILGGLLGAYAWAQLAEIAEMQDIVGVNMAFAMMTGLNEKRVTPVTKYPAVMAVLFANLPWIFGVLGAVLS